MGNGDSEKIQRTGSGDGNAQTSLNFHTLVNERNEWIARNFPGDTLEHSIEGVVEELGELTHHRLKMTQRVRGEEPFHRAEMKDAIGDMTIFLLGVMARYGVPSSFEAYSWSKSTWRVDTFAIRITVLVGELCEDCTYDLGHSPVVIREDCGYIVGELRALCNYYGWDYDQIVLETWDAVKQRDWVRYPDTGLPPAHETAQQAAARAFRETEEETT